MILKNKDWIDYMKRSVVFMVIILSVLLPGCANQQRSEGENNMEAYQINSLTKDQKESKRAEQKLLALDEVVEVVAVNNDDQLLIGYKLKQFAKLRTKQVEAKINKQLKKEFPNHETNASSDLKIFIETEKIKSNLEKNKISDNKKLDSQMKKIIKLSNEQT
ncbi:YhcN/YlaJ family sporulation lipoprotein [Litchfieldia alkalitelluris]|uniref:YhcN/YlaJ family sporulation lipoprotein n=1 Tax=Litchfieldia alkalitelluris TaxID=304268 RepID=UPI000996C3C9|nr:YhcN/YlaJ family sporulation lipoprotein [Litchfieldia alkalitelluris]